MVAHLDDAAVRIHLVGAEEVEDAVVGEDRGVDRIVLQPGEVLAFVDRPVEELARVVIGAQRHRVDESRAGAIGKGRAIPEVVGMHPVGEVGNAYLLVEVGLARMQGDADGPLRAEDLLDVVDFEEGGAVGVLARDYIDRRNDGDGVALRTAIPFHSAADPRAAHGDHAGFDDLVGVKHLLVRGLVENGVQSPAQFWEAGDFEILVFQKEGLVVAIDLGTREVVLHRIRIGDRPFHRRREFGRAFHGPELGIDVVFPRIRGQPDRATPGFDLLGGRAERGEKKEEAEDARDGAKSFHELLLEIRVEHGHIVVRARGGGNVPSLYSYPW